MITGVRQCKTRERTQIHTYVHGYSNTMHACDTVVKKVPSVEMGGGGGQTIAPRQKQKGRGREALPAPWSSENSTHIQESDMAPI